MGGGRYKYHGHSGVYPEFNFSLWEIKKLKMEEMSVWWCFKAQISFNFSDVTQQQRDVNATRGGAEDTRPFGSVSTFGWRQLTTAAPYEIFIIYFILTGWTNVCIWLHLLKTKFTGSNPAVKL